MSSTAAAFNRVNTPPALFPVSRVNSVNYWPKKTLRSLRLSYGLILIPEAIALKTIDLAQSSSSRSQTHFDLNWRHPAKCLVQYNLGHFVEKQVGFGAILRGEHSGFGELLVFGSKVWRWSGAMPGIPSTLGRILHSSTTSTKSIDFNFFTITFFTILINPSHSWSTELLSIDFKITFSS